MWNTWVPRWKQISHLTQVAKSEPVFTWLAMIQAMDMPPFPCVWAQQRFEEVAAFTAFQRVTERAESCLVLWGHLGGAQAHRSHAQLGNTNQGMFG